MARALHKNIFPSLKSTEVFSNQLGPEISLQTLGVNYMHHLTPENLYQAF